MSAGVVITELRRGGALFAGALVAASGVAGLAVAAVIGDAASLWAGQWVQLAMFGRSMLLILCPLAATAGAWQGRREQRFRMAEMLGTTPVPGWRRQLPLAVATACCLAVGELLIVAAGAPAVASGTGWFAPAALTVAATGAVAVMAAGWLGFGVGRAVPLLFTPVAVGVGGVVLFGSAFEAAKAGNVPLLLPAFAAQLGEYDTVAPSISIGQSVWFAGLGAGGLVLALAAGRFTRLLALVPPALGLAVALPMLNVPAAAAFPTEARAVAEVCTHDAGPPVCVTRMHATDLSTLVGPARQALRLLATLPDPPSSVHEVTGDRGDPQPAAQVWFDSDNHNPSGGWGTKTPEELTARILVGAGTLQCARTQADGSYLAARRARVLVAAWLYGEYPAPGLKAPVPAEEKARASAWQQLSRLSAGQQKRRVAAVRAAGLGCGDQAAAAGVVGSGR